jgi:hypothetical protein
MLFDHSIAHASGVSGVASGTAIQVGAVSATQTIKVFYGNLHDPAPTITTADAILESAGSEDFLTTPVTEVTFTQVTSTASYQVATVAGAVTNDWWRLRVTAVVGGVYYPVCVVAIYTT